MRDDDEVMERQPACRAWPRRRAKRHGGAPDVGMTRQQSVAGLGCGWLGQRTGSGPRKVTGSPATAAEAEERRGRDLKRLRDVAGWIGLRLPQIESKLRGGRGNDFSNFEADEVTDF